MQNFHSSHQRQSLSCLTHSFHPIFIHSFIQSLGLCIKKLLCRKRGRDRDGEDMTRELSCCSILHDVHIWVGAASVSTANNKSGQQTLSGPHHSSQSSTGFNFFILSHHLLLLLLFSHPRIISITIITLIIGKICPDTRHHDSTWTELIPSDDPSSFILLVIKMVITDDGVLVAYDDDHHQRHHHHYDDYHQTVDDDAVTDGDYDDDVD